MEHNCERSKLHPGAYVIYANDGTVWLARLRDGSYPKARRWSARPQQGTRAHEMGMHLTRSTLRDLARYLGNLILPEPVPAPVTDPAPWRIKLDGRIGGWQH